MRTRCFQLRCLTGVTVLFVLQKKTFFWGDVVFGGKVTFLDVSKKDTHFTDEKLTKKFFATVGLSNNNWYLLQ